MTNTTALPAPTAARARRARDQFDPARLPKSAADIAAGKTYSAELTAATCRALPFPDSGRYYVKWAGHRGLTLHVTRDRKTLYGRARGESNGGWQMVGELGALLDECGTFPAIARHASALLGEVARGTANPTAERAAERAVKRASGRTVAEVVGEYLAGPTKYGQPRAAETVEGLTGSIRRFCGPAWDKPMRALCDANTIAELFALRVAVSRHDARRALEALDTLGRRTREYRALRDAIADARDLNGINPGAKAHRQCGYDARKPSKIVKHWENVSRTAVTANYRLTALRYYVSLFVPLRIGTLSQLRWRFMHEDENGGGMLRIPAELFKKTEAMRRMKVVELPVPPRLYALMCEMREAATSPLMFPSATDADKPMGEVDSLFHSAHGIESTQWTGKAGRQDGRYCTIHDGRRLAGAITTAHKLGEKAALKGLLTHSHLRGDVTDGYIGEAPYWAVRELSHDYETFLWGH